MTRTRRHLALGLARAMLAGGRDRDGLVARMSYVLGDVSPGWLQGVAELVLPLSTPSWDALDIEDLANRIEAHTGFIHGCLADVRPCIRRWILRSAHMHRPPLGLDLLPLPRIDHAQDLAAWLGVSPDDLDWLCADPQRRSHAALHSQHYLFSMRPKALGGVRLIEAPKARLKAVQARILDDLLTRVPVHEQCHGFVRGRSLRGHAQAHAGQAVVIRFDLRNFFASVTAAQVRAVFETLGYAPSVARDLGALCTVLTPAPVLDRMRDDGWLDWHQARSLRRAHLPQGAPTSPMLANLCAFDMDLRLDGLAAAMNAHYSRYADDIIFSGNASLAAAFPRLQAWVGKIAREEGREINHRKTRLMTRATAQTVCGIVVNDGPNMRRDDFDRLRATLHRCALGRIEPPDSLSADEWRQQLRGRIQWAEQLNPAKARRLHALWKRIDWPPITASPTVE